MSFTSSELRPWALNWRGGVWRSAMTSCVRWASPIILDPSENRKWFYWDSYFCHLYFWHFISGNCVTGKVFWRQCYESSFWVIILVYLCTFFWGWYSQILTLTERGGKEDIKREETISSISLPYFVLLQRSKNQRRRKAQKFKRIQKNFWEIFENLRAVQWIAVKGKISKIIIWAKNYDFRKMKILIISVWKKVIFGEKFTFTLAPPQNNHFCWNRVT